VSVVFVGAGAATTQRTTADGVFTVAQAKRGAAVFDESCVSCHPRQSNGTIGTLSGPVFAARWREHTLDQLFERVSLTMPENAPASLSPQAAADVIAYLLQINGAPAGRAELSATAERLADIRINWTVSGSDII